MKLIQGFSGIGITVTLSAIAVIAILIQPTIDRWTVKREVNDYIVTLERVAEDAELYYQANCLEPAHSPSLSNYQNSGLLRFSPLMRTPWRGDFPAIGYQNWGSSNPRVNIAMPNVPLRFISALKSASENIVIQGNNAFYNRSIAFSYDEQQQSLIENRRLFDESGC